MVSYKGTVKFVLCAKKGTELEWNTTIAEGTVLEGLEATDEVVERNPDIIEQILTRLDNVTEIPQEKVAEAVSTYMEANPINVPKNLSDLKEDSEHRTVTDAEKQSWDNKSNFSGNYEDLRGKPELAEWAKAEEKPTYTAEEVGALPSTTVIPKNLSDLEEDTTHRTVTDKEKQSWNANLPNTQALTITYGGRTYTYNGSEAVAITIETGGIERIEKLSTDTTVTLEPNKLYVFPEMKSLTYTIGEGTGEVHFIFRSGATATRVVHPSNVNIGSFSVDANKVYEVSVLEGLLTSQNWSVS